jgi:uroporphyrinogen decarboxylase
MNSKERVLTTLSHREPDRVPYFEQGVASSVTSEILGREAHTGGGGFRRDGIEAALCGPDAYAEYIQKSLQDWGDLIETLDFDVVTLPWFGKGEPTRKMDENTYLLGYEGSDDWSVIRLDSESDTLYTIDSAARSGDVSFVERRVRAMRELHSRREPLTSDSFPELKIAIERFGGKRAIGGGAGIAVPLEPAWLEAVVLRPDLVGEYLDMQSEVACEAIEVQAAMGIDLVWGGGDMANNSGPIYSPGHFRSLVLPRLKRMVEVCHKHHLPYIFRTDGVIWPLAQYLFIESGVDGYGEIDKQAGMDVGEVRRRLPHLTLWGNVDCGRTLTSGTREDVIAETKDCIDKAAAGGGYILGSSNVIHSRVPTSNFLAMIETCREYGRY